MSDIVRFHERHGQGVLRLIGGVFAEYGLTFDPLGYDVDLTRIHDEYVSRGGEFWVLEHEGVVHGTVAVVPVSAVAVEIKRVYVHPALRGQGVGRRLVEHAIGWAAGRGHHHITLWSDVKFATSHRMYERLGFVRTGMRDCDDLDRSCEYGFEKRLPAFATTPR